MKRVSTVILIAMLTALVSGINDVSWASQGFGSQERAHRERIAAALKAIPLGVPIEIDPVRGRKFQAILDSVTDDAINVRLMTGNFAVTRLIPFDEIQSLKRIRAINSHRGRNIAILVGIGAAAVLVGTCANSLSGDMVPGAKPEPAKTAQ